MIRKIYLTSILLFFGIQGYTQSSENKILIGPVDIEEIITLKESDKLQQAILIKFRKSYSGDDHISVEEYQNYFKITVDHPNIKGYTGGAEAYKVDKKTGESEMIWHEHPTEIPKTESQEDKKINPGYNKSLH